MKIAKIIRANFGLLIFVGTINCLFLTSACNRKPDWNGEFIGSAIERLEKRDSISKPDPDKVESKTSQNYEVTISKIAENESVITFGTCSLHLQMLPDLAYVREGQSCLVAVNGNEADMVLHGEVRLVKDSLTFVFRGTKVDNFKSTIYSLDFSGRKK